MEKYIQILYYNTNYKQMSIVQPRWRESGVDALLCVWTCCRFGWMSKRLCPSLLGNMTSDRVLEEYSNSKQVLMAPDRTAISRWINIVTDMCDCGDVESRSVLLVTWHLLFCPSWRGILLCCSPEGSFPFFPVKGCLGVFPDPMWGQRSGMSMCTDCKANL